MTPAETKELQTFQPDFEDGPDDETLLMARIPLLSGSVNKVHYLGWRAMGFTVRESANLATVTEQTVRRWRKEDSDFEKWESEKLKELQSTVASDLLEIDFKRNMKLAMAPDTDVLYKAACNLHSLTEREYDYLKKIRGFYTAAGLIEMQRAMAPIVEDRDGTTAKLTVTIDAREVHDETGRRAAARQLLDKFRVNISTEVSITGEVKQEDNDDTIEGTAKEIPEEVVGTPASTLQDSD